MIDDIDAITPCPLTESTNNNNNNDDEPITPRGPTTTTMDTHMHTRSWNTRRSASPASSFASSAAETANSRRRRESLKAIEEGTDGDPDRLWRRMLVLQQKFGCYNSARMSAALCSGNFSILRPSKACLDLLNENMTATLPETLVDWLRPN